MRSERLEYLDFYRSELGVAKHCTKSFGYAVWQHQQTKVDELQSMFVEQARTASNQQAKIDELQKRVDGLTQVIEKLLEEMKYPTATFEEVICCGVKELEQALKSGSDASN